MKELKEIIVILSNILIFFIIITICVGSCVFKKNVDYTEPEKVLGKHITSDEDGIPSYYVITETGSKCVMSTTYINLEKDDFLNVRKSKEINRFESINFPRMLIFKFLVIFTLIYFILRITWLSDI